MARTTNQRATGSRLTGETVTQQQHRLEILSLDETMTIRGGDKEYKPLYDEPQDEIRIKFTNFFNLF